MWSLVIAIRTPVKYVVTGDYLTGVLMAMTIDHIFDRCSDGNHQ
jgi:hypothetical protein